MDSCLTSPSECILDIEFLRALQPGTPTPQSRIRSRAPALRPLGTTETKFMGAPPFSLSQRAWGEPKTPRSPTSSVNKNEPCTPIMQTTFSFGTQGSYLSDRSEPVISPRYDYRQDLRSYYVDDEDEDDLYDESFYSLQSREHQLPSIARKASMSPSEMDNLPPFHIVIWDNNGDEILVPPTHPDWRCLWTAICDPHSQTLSKGTYVWRDESYIERVRHVLEDAAEQVRTSRSPQKCPLPPHLADLERCQVVLSSSTGEEMLMDEDSPISRLLMEGNWDMDVEGELPYDTTFRWRDQHGDTWVFQSLPSQPKSGNRLSLGSNNTLSDVSSFTDSFSSSSMFSEDSSEPSPDDGQSYCDSEDTHTVRVHFALPCLDKPGNTKLVYMKSPGVQSIPKQFFRATIPTLKVPLLGRSLGWTHAIREIVTSALGR